MAKLTNPTKPNLTYLLDKAALSTQFFETDRVYLAFYNQKSYNINFITIVTLSILIMYVCQSGSVVAKGRMITTYISPDEIVL